MPASFSLVFLLLVFSASMSTLSSLVLVSSSAITIDLLYSRIKERSLPLMRILCVVFIFFSLLIAFYRVTFIVNLMSISWGANAGSFIVPYLYRLFWKRANLAGAMASVISGLGFAVVVSLAYGFTSRWIPLIGSVSILIPLGVLPLVTILTKKKPVRELETEGAGA